MTNQTEARSETFTTPGAVRLVLRIPIGSIRVDADDAGETQVVLAAGDDHERSRRAVAGATISHRREGDVEVVEVALERRFTLGRPGSVAARVRCPPGSDLVAEVATADVEAHGRLGAVRVQTATGDVAVEEASGRVTIDTASGDARLGRVGDRLRVQSASGSLDVAEAADVDAKSASGDVRIGRVAAGKLELRVVSGDLRVGVARGSRVSVDATTVSGDLQSEVELGDAPLTDAAGGPLVELRARTVSGDVRIHRA